MLFFITLCPEAIFVCRMRGCDDATIAKDYGVDSFIESSNNR